MEMISKEIKFPTEDLIDVACKQALKNLIWTTEKKDNIVKKECSYTKATMSVPVIEKDASKMISPVTEPADCDEEVGEEDVDTEDEPEFDPKLLLIPTVCTTKLDHMGLFDHNSFNYVDNKELIDLVYIKSNPLRKNIVKSEKNMDVESVLIDTSDDEDNGMEDNGCYYAENKNRSNDNNDDDVELIENNISEADRVLLSSNLFKKPQIHNYNHSELLKNPDFEKSLKELNLDVNALVNSAVLYSNDGEHSDHRKEDTKDPKIQLCPSKGPLALSTCVTSDHESMKSDTLITSPSQSKEITGNSERNRAVNLPNITEVRRVNQKLLTAEVPPVQTQKSSIQVQTNTVKSSITSYPKIAPKMKIYNSNLAKSTISAYKCYSTANKKGKLPPVIMFPQVDSASNIQKNNVPNPNVTYTVSKTNVQTSNTASINSVVAPKVECTCAARELVQTLNGNIIVKTTKCSLHNNIKVKTISNELESIMSKVNVNGRVFLKTRPTLRVTSEPTRQKSAEMPQNLILPSNVQLLELLTGEMVYAFSPSSTLNLLSGGTAIESTASGDKLQNRFMFSVDDNSSQSNSVPNTPDGVDPILTTTPVEQSNNLAINNISLQNEKRSVISVVDDNFNKLESDNQHEINLSQLGTNDSNFQNEKQCNTVVVDNKPGETVATPDKSVEQPRFTLAIRAVKSISKLQDTNPNKSSFYKMNLVTGEITPYKYQNQITNTPPKPMTIDLTDDDETPTGTASTPISPKNNVVKSLTEKSTEQKSPQKNLELKSQTNFESKPVLNDHRKIRPKILTSGLGKKNRKQNKNVDDAKQVTEQYLSVGQGNVQQKLNKINEEINHTKGSTNPEDSYHAKPASNSEIQTRKRNSKSAKLPNQKPFAKMSLLKSFDAITKNGPAILETNEDDSDTNKEQESTSRWVLLGL